MTASECVLGSGNIYRDEGLVNIKQIHYSQNGFDAGRSGVHLGLKKYKNKFSTPQEIQNIDKLCSLDTFLPKTVWLFLDTIRYLQYTDVFNRKDWAMVAYNYVHPIFILATPLLA